MIQFDSSQIKTIAKQVKTKDPALSAALMSLRSDMPEDSRVFMAVGILTHAPSYSPESVCQALWLPLESIDTVKVALIAKRLQNSDSKATKAEEKARLKAEREAKRQASQERQRQARKNKKIFTVSGPEVDELSTIVPVVGKWLTENESVYLSGGLLARWSDSKECLEILNKDSLAPLLDLGFSFKRIKTTAFGDMDEFLTMCPDDIRKSILATGYFHGIREVNGLLQHPVLTLEGELLGTKAGYNEEHKILFTKDTPLHPVDLEVAYRTLHDVFHEFPEKCVPGAFATMFTLLTRMFLPTAPMICVVAPSQGSGKSLFARCCLNIVYNDIKTQAQAEDQEFDKATKAFMQNNPGTCMFFDDFDGYIKYSILKTILTEPKSYSFRILGQPKNCTIRTNFPTVMTGNQLELSADLTRRSIQISIDTGLENPSHRKCSRNTAQLLKYVEDNRILLLSSLVCILQDALKNMTDDHRVRVMGSFEDWADTVGRATMYATEKLKSYGLLTKSVDGDVTPDMATYALLQGGAGECFEEIYKEANQANAWRIRDLPEKCIKSLDSLLGITKDSANDRSRGARLQKHKDIPRTYEGNTYMLKRLTHNRWKILKVLDGVPIDTQYDFADNHYKTTANGEDLPF